MNLVSTSSVINPIYLPLDLYFLWQGCRQVCSDTKLLVSIASKHWRVKSSSVPYRSIMKAWRQYALDHALGSVAPVWHGWTSYRWTIVTWRTFSFWTSKKNLPPTPTLTCTNTDLGNELIILNVLIIPSSRKGNIFACVMLAVCCISSFYLLPLLLLLLLPTHLPPKTRLGKYNDHWRLHLNWMVLLALSQIMATNGYLCPTGLIKIHCSFVHNT